MKGPSILWYILGKKSGNVMPLLGSVSPKGRRRRGWEGDEEEEEEGGDSSSNITASLATLWRSKELFQFMPALEHSDKTLDVYKITAIHKNMYHSIKSVK